MQLQTVYKAPTTMQSNTTSWLIWQNPADKMRLLNNTGFFLNVGILEWKCIVPGNNDKGNIVLLFIPDFVKMH